MAWTDGAPSPSDSPDARLASLFTTQKIAFRTAIEKFSFWTDSSLASTGVPRLSDGSFGPGACRAFFAPASSFSTTLTGTKPVIGRFFVTSNTTRLYTWVPAIAAYGFLDAETPILVGSKNAIVWQGASQVTMQTNARVVTQIGTTPITSSTTTQITFPVSYAATAPVVQVQVFSSVTTAMAVAQVTSLLSTGFILSVGTVFGTTADYTCTWRSHGTASL